MTEFEQWYKDEYGVYPKDVTKDTPADAQLQASRKAWEEVEQELNRLRAEIERLKTVKASQSKIDTAFNKAKDIAFDNADANGSWTWSPTPWKAFTLGWRACEESIAKVKK